MCKVVYETDWVILKCIAWYSHVRRETDNLFFIDNEFLFETGWVLIWVNRLIKHRYGHAIEVFSSSTRVFIHEDLGMAIPKEFWNIRFDLTNEGFEGSMLNEATYKANDTTFHQFLVLHLNVVREYLHAWFGKHWNDLAHREVIVVPEATQGTRPSIHAFCYAGLPRSFTSVTHCHGSCNSLGSILFVLSRSGTVWCSYTTGHISNGSDLIWLQLHCKHKQLVIEDGNINQALLVLWLRSRLDRRETGFAVLFRILKDCIHNVVSTSHLDCFKVPFLITHILKDVSLEVAVHYENCAPCHIFEGLFEGLQYLLHSLEGWLANNHLLHLLVYHFNFLYVNLLSAAATKSAERSHRVPIIIFNWVWVKFTVFPR